MGYSGGRDGKNPSFNFFGEQRDEPYNPGSTTMPVSQAPAADPRLATVANPGMLGGYPDRSGSPLLTALRRGSGGGGEADYGDPRRAQFDDGDMQRRLRGLFAAPRPRYDPRRAQGQAGGYSPPPNNPYAPNPNATRGYQV